MEIGIENFEAESERVSSALEQLADRLGQIGEGLAYAFGEIQKIAEFGSTLESIYEGLSVFGEIKSAIEKLFEADGVIGSLFLNNTIFTPASFFAIAVAIAAVVAALVDLWNTSEQFRDAVGEAFGCIRESAGDAFVEIRKAIGPLWNSLKELGDSLYELYEVSGIKGLVEDFASLAAVLLGIFGSAVIDAFADGIAGLCSVFTGFADIIGGVADILTGIFSWDFDSLSESFGKIGQGIFEVLEGLVQSITGISFEDIFGFPSDGGELIIENMLAGWELVSTWFSEHVIEPVVAVFQELWIRIQQIFEGLWLIVQAIWQQFIIWVSDSFIEPIKLIFVAFQETIHSLFYGLWEKIKFIFGGVFGWFQEHLAVPLEGLFTKSKECIVNVFGGAWNTVKLMVTNTVNGIITIIERMINRVIGGINNLLAVFNKYAGQAADLLGKDWDGVTLFDEVHFTGIDGYTGDGYPETGAGFLAQENRLNEMAGRFGRHSAVANNDDIVDAVSYGVSVANETTNGLLQELISVMRQGNVIEIDGTSVFKAVRGNANEFHRRTGMSPFPV